MTSTDPRINNVLFNSNSASAYFEDYISNLQLALSSINKENIENAFVLMKKISARNGTFFIAGNGGSASIANHLCCDWTKGSFIEGQPVLRTHSLVANTSLMSAISNDFGDQSIFATQLKMLATDRDALIVISSSGKSPNIVAALETAKQMKIPTLSFTGFSGGPAREMADVNIHVNFNNYAIVEDAHQSAMQALAQYFFCHHNSGK